jgi:hypothetical protein
VKINPRRASRRPVEPARDEPLLVWWMPIAGIVLALAWAAWRGATEEGLESFLTALVWPGVAILAVTTFLVWLAWKVEFD